MNFIKRTTHMEKQWQNCQRDTMRFERNEHIDKSPGIGSQETI